MQFVTAENSRKKLSYNTILHRTFVCLFYAAVFLKYVISLPIPGFVLLAIFASAAAFADRDHIVMLSVAIIPLYTSFQFIFGIAICALIYIVKYSSGIKLRIPDLILLFLSAWELLHAFDKNFAVKEFVGFLLPYLFLMFVIRSYDVKDAYARIARSYSASTIYTSVIILLQLFAKNRFNAERSWKSLLRLGDSVVDGQNGAYLNPNTLGFFVILGIAMLIQLVICKKHRSFDVAAIALLMLMGLFTSSRTFLLCFAVTGVFTLFAVPRGKSRVRAAAIGVTSAAAAVVLFRIISPSTFEFFFRRIINPGDNSRADLFSRYNDLIFSNVRYFLWGNGLNGVADAEMKLVGQVSHNGFQEVLFVWGLPGFAAYFTYIISIVADACRKCKKIRLINWLPFIVLIVKSQFGQLITFVPIPLVFLLIYLSLTNDFGLKNSR